jgi:hypothetical protein
MWKQIYIYYQLHHPNLIFIEKTLKDHLCDTLKDLKIGTSNEEGLEKPTLQCDDVLEHLNAIDGHVTRNVLKRCQNLLDGPLVFTVMAMKVTKFIGFFKPRQEGLIPILLHKKKTHTHTHVQDKNLIIFYCKNKNEIIINHDKKMYQKLVLKN